MAYKLLQHHEYVCDVKGCDTAITYDATKMSKEDADRKVQSECGFVIRKRGIKRFHFCEEHSEYE